MTLRDVDSSRVVVSGMGVVSPFGAGLDALWRGLERGRQPIEPMKLFGVEGRRAQVAAVVPEGAIELPAVFGQSVKERSLSRTDCFALTAAWEAWSTAGLGAPGSHPSAGLFFGSGTGGMLEGELAYWALREVGADRARYREFAKQPNGTPAEVVARAFGMCGPQETLASACSASTMALEAALDALRSGEVELALAGGADEICQTSFGGFDALRAMDPRPARPFRADREGMSLGEGAGLLVLETEAHALARGAKPLAVVAGASSSCDAHHMTAPHPEGEGVARAMRAALHDAGLEPEDIAFLNAHGSGTPQNDVAEACAIRAVFGSHAQRMPVTSTKGAIGHGLGTCGALEAVATILCLLHGAVHATPGAGPVDPDAAVDLVLGAPRALDTARAAMSVNLAFGGANAALVLQPWAGASSSQQ